jgi:hypothetical protein
MQRKISYKLCWKIIYLSHTKVANSETFAWKRTSGSASVITLRMPIKSQTNQKHFLKDDGIKDSVDGPATKRFFLVNR